MRKRLTQHISNLQNTLAGDKRQKGKKRESKRERTQESRVRGHGLMGGGDNLKSGAPGKLQ